MPKPLESAIERRAVSRIQMELGVESIKLVKRKGLPDRLFLIPGGIPLLVEFKRPGEAPTGYQLITHTRLRSYGYAIEVHDTVQGAFDAVKRAIGRSAAYRAE